MEDNKKTYKAQFKQGFRKNSIAIILIAFIISLTLTFVPLENMMLKLENILLNMPLGYLLEDETDYTTYTTYKLHEIKQSDNNAYNIYLLGGSSTREAIISHDHIEELINREYQIDANVELLTLNIMSMMDMLQIVDNLPSGQGAVVLSLSSRNITQREFFNNIYIKSDRYTELLHNNEYIQKIHNGAENGYTHYTLLWAKKLLNSFFNNPQFIVTYKEIDLHHFVKKEKIDLHTYIQSEKERQKKVHPDDVKFFVDIMDIIIETAHSKGLELIIWDTPYNVNFMGDELYEEGTKYTYYTKAIDEITKTQDIYYFDYIKDLGLEDEDYFDVVHIKTKEAQQMIEEGFVESFGALAR